MLLQYWAPLNPLHGSQRRIVLCGRHTYLCLSIFFCTLFANFTDFQYFVLHWNILKLFQSCSEIQWVSPGLPAVCSRSWYCIYCHTASLQQNLDSIKIIDFRNGFSLWPGLIFVPLTRPTPATNTIRWQDQTETTLSRVPTRVQGHQHFGSFVVGEHF